MYPVIYYRVRYSRRLQLSQDFKKLESSIRFPYINKKNKNYLETV